MLDPTTTARALRDASLLESFHLMTVSMMALGLKLHGDSYFYTDQNSSMMNMMMGDIGKVNRRFTEEIDEVTEAWKEALKKLERGEL